MENTQKYDWMYLVSASIVLAWFMVGSSVI